MQADILRTDSDFVCTYSDSLWTRFNLSQTPLEIIHSTSLEFYKIQWPPKDSPWLVRTLVELVQTLYDSLKLIRALLKTGPNLAETIQTPLGLLKTPLTLLGAVKIISDLGLTETHSDFLKVIWLLLKLIQTTWGLVSIYFHRLKTQVIQDFLQLVNTFPWDSLRLTQTFLGFFRTLSGFLKSGWDSSCRLTPSLEKDSLYSFLTHSDAFKNYIVQTRLRLIRTHLRLVETYSTPL